jgi:hypothetical protein
MKNENVLLTLIVALFLVACNSTQEEEPKKKSIIEVKKGVKPEKQFPNALKNGKIFTKNGVKYMYGGEDSTKHFDISNSILKDENFHFGIGREKFQALLEPEFISIAEADTTFSDSSRFLILNINNDVRAYSVDLLTHHEIINDMVDGVPIMAAYCVLADLGAIYDRTLGGKVFTFGLSGYTYHDDKVWNGLDGFVFWDRETESTWWPLIGKAVSGPMLETKLIEHDKTEWEDITWEEIKLKYKNVKVLKPNQTMEPPANWKKLNEEQVKNVKEKLVTS